MEEEGLRNNGAGSGSVPEAGIYLCRVAKSLPRLTPSLLLGALLLPIFFPTFCHVQHE